MAATASHSLCAMRSRDRKSTRLNSSHLVISYAVFCLKKKKGNHRYHALAHPSRSPRLPRDSRARYKPIAGPDGNAHRLVQPTGDAAHVGNSHGGSHTD